MGNWWDPRQGHYYKWGGETLIFSWTYAHPMAGSPTIVPSVQQIPCTLGVEAAGRGSECLLTVGREPFHFWAEPLLTQGLWGQVREKTLGLAERHQFCPSGKGGARLSGDWAVCQGHSLHLPKLVCPTPPTPTSASLQRA